MQVSSTGLTRDNEREFIRQNYTPATFIPPSYVDSFVDSFSIPS